MAKMTLEVMNSFNDQTALKLLSTVSKDSKVNAVPVATLSAMDDQTLMFADMFLGKTARNLDVNKKVAVTVLQQPKTSYQIEGELITWVKSGPIYKMVGEMIQEAMGKAIRRVGMISVNAVYEVSVGEPENQLA